jgi:hypothetical protein
MQHSSSLISHLSCSLPTYSSQVILRTRKERANWTRPHFLVAAVAWTSCDEIMRTSSLKSYIKITMPVDLLMSLCVTYQRYYWCCSWRCCCWFDASFNWSWASSGNSAQDDQRAIGTRMGMSHVKWLVYVVQQERYRRVSEGEEKKLWTNQTTEF